MGYKYGNKIAAFFENADVMVFPTYYNKECFPLVLLEGMMHGLACVSTREAGIPENIDSYPSPLEDDDSSSTKPTDILV